MEHISDHDIEKGAPQGTPFAPPPAVDESSLTHWQMIHHGSDYNHFQCPCLLTGCMNLLCGFCLMGRPKREMQHKSARNIFIIIGILTEAEIETYSLRLRRMQLCSGVFYCVNNPRKL